MTFPLFSPFLSTMKSPLPSSAPAMPRRGTPPPKNRRAARGGAVARGQGVW